MNPLRILLAASIAARRDSHRSRVLGRGTPWGRGALQTLFLLLAAALAARAHEGEPLAPHDVWTAWEFDPLIVAGLALSGWLYRRGSRPLRTDAAPGRGIRPREAACFWSGWAALALALVSPLHPVGEVLFSAHMVQHEVLMVVAAPLLVLGRPLVPFLWGMPEDWRRTAGRWAKRRWFEKSWGMLSAPPAAWSIHAVALWLWHAPPLFDASVESELVHTAQHISFLGSALLFWWALLRGRGGRSGYGAAVLYVFTTAVHSSVLGVLLTFAPTVWYSVYRETTAAWGLTPLQDQQLGGLVMWVPAGVAFLTAGLFLFAAWLRESELRAADWNRNLAILACCALGALTLSCDRSAARAAAAATGGDVARGRVAIARRGCATCHTIPGIPGAEGLVGPPLTRFASRVYIAGVLPNTPENLVRWLKDPPAVDSQTAMPDMGIPDAEARDIASYLLTLK